MDEDDDEDPEIVLTEVYRQVAPGSVFVGFLLLLRVLLSGIFIWSQHSTLGIFETDWTCINYIVVSKTKCYSEGVFQMLG